MSGFDRVILGSNPFVGVSYLSREKRLQYMESFSNPNNVVKIIEKSMDLGINSMMCSNNPACINALNQISVDGTNFGLYPVLPNVYEYSRGISKSGIMGFVKTKMKGAKLYDKVKLALRGGVNLLSKDTIKKLSSLVDLELLFFKKFNMKSIILHGSLTDLGLALGNEELFQFFIKYVEENYGVTAGFATHNFGKMISLFQEWNIEAPLIMAPFNNTGFLMNPSQKECLKRLHETNSHIIAKKILSGGRIPPNDALEYISSLKKIKSVVLGIGSLAEAEETFSLAKSLLFQ